MLMTNLEESGGLTNDVMGEKTNIIVPENTYMVSTILVYFDSSRLGEEAKFQNTYRQTSPDFVPIKWVYVTFHIRGKVSYQASCTKLLLFLCWTITMYKCQGMTLSEIVVGMTPSKGCYKAG